MTSIFARLRPGSPRPCPEDALLLRPIRPIQTHPTPRMLRRIPSHPDPSSDSKQTGRGDAHPIPRMPPGGGRRYSGGPGCIAKNKAFPSTTMGAATIERLTPICPRSRVRVIVSELAISVLRLFF